MDLDFGCLSCDYMIPGCRSCSVVDWDTNIPLDNARMMGPDSDPSYLTCNECSTSERFVDESSGNRVTCKHC